MHQFEQVSAAYQKRREKFRDTIHDGLDPLLQQRLRECISETDLCMDEMTKFLEEFVRCQARQKPEDIRQVAAMFEARMADLSARLEANPDAEEKERLLTSAQILLKASESTRLASEAQSVKSKLSIVAAEIASATVRQSLMQLLEDNNLEKIGKALEATGETLKGQIPTYDFLMLVNEILDILKGDIDVQDANERLLSLGAYCQAARAWRTMTGQATNLVSTIK